MESKGVVQHLDDLTFRQSNILPERPWFAGPFPKFHPEAFTVGTSSWALNHRRLGHRIFYERL